MRGNAPANQLELGFELLDRVKPDRGARSGETLIGGERIEHPAQCWAQRTEPPYADPHVRWCGRGERVTAPPMPINDALIESYASPYKETAVRCGLLQG